MKGILFSVKPRDCENIASGKKTVIACKKMPKLQTPFKVYIYQTRKPVLVLFSGTGRHISEYDKIRYYEKGSGKIIGEFVCDEILEYKYGDNPIYSPYGAYRGKMKGYSCWQNKGDNLLMTNSEMEEFGKGKNFGGLRITELKIYDTPKELSEFYKVGTKSLEELDCDELCKYCAPTNYGERRVHLVPNAGAAFCEGDYCEEAYRKYLEQEFALTRPPQGWVYVQELEV